MKTKRIHVYDLDGVLVDTSHRYRNTPEGKIDLVYWFKMRTKENISKDKILPMAKQYIDDCLNPEIYTVICTSRMYHENDIEFIVGYLGAPDKLLMRPEGEKGRDDFLKYNQLRRLFNIHEFQKLPRALWEDNKQNIRTLAPLFSQTNFVQSNIAYTHE
jgi:hypothetical protein